MKSNIYIKIRHPILKYIILNHIIILFNIRVFGLNNLLNIMMVENLSQKEKKKKYSICISAFFFFFFCNDDETT